MNSPASIGWFLFGFAMATAVAAVAAIGPVRAQDATFEPLVSKSDTLLTRPRQSAGARGGLSGLPSDPGLRVTLMPDRMYDGDESAAAPRRRAAVKDSGTSSREPRSGQDGGQPMAEPSSLPDGRHANPDFRVRNEDGRQPTPDQGAVRDGEDPLRVDTRQGADAEAFLTPHEISDRTLSMLEVEPLSGRLADRLFRFEPYERVGYSVGSFIVFPEVELGALWHSNVTRTADARADIAAVATPTVEVLSNWNAHALGLRGTGNFGAYSELADENDRAYQLEARGRIDVTRRTNFEALAGRSLAQEQRSSIDARRSGERSDITTDRAVLAFNTRFNRLSLQLRGAIEDVVFGATTDAAGLTDFNRDRNSVRRSVAARAQWEFKPALYGFAETGGDQRDFEVASANDGILRDSRGSYVKAGVGFGSLSNTLRGEVGVGYRKQDFEDGRLADTGGLLLDADVAWRVSALGSLRLRSQTDVAETTFAGSGGGLARRVEVAYRHALRQYLIATAGLGYAWQNYAGTTISDSAATANAGLDYYVSRELVLFARYQHTAFRSDDALRNYDDDLIGIGVRIRR